LACELARRAKGGPAVDAMGVRFTHTNDSRQAGPYPRRGEFKGGAYVVEREDRIRVVRVDPALRPLRELTALRASHLEATQAVNCVLQNGKMQCLRPYSPNLLLSMKKLEVLFSLS